MIPMKTALITGASRGLGKAIADMFSKHGYGLIMHCKNSCMVLPSIQCITVRGDIRDKQTIENLASIADKMDIDVLVNNAGMYLRKPFYEISDDEYREIFDVNLLAPILLTKAIWPIFYRKGKGVIVNINSVAGQQGTDCLEAAYCASKHGLKGFSDSIRSDIAIAKSNIWMVDIYPSGMKTDMTKGRKGWENLPGPEKTAQLVFDLCDRYQVEN